MGNTISDAGGEGGVPTANFAAAAAINCGEKAEPRNWDLRTQIFFKSKNAAIMNA